MQKRISEKLTPTSLTKVNATMSHTAGIFQRQGVPHHEAYDR